MLLRCTPRTVLLGTPPYIPRKIRPVSVRRTFFMRHYQLKFTVYWRGAYGSLDRLVIKTHTDIPTKVVSNRNPNPLTQFVQVGRLTPTGSRLGTPGPILSSRLLPTYETLVYRRHCVRTTGVSPVRVYLTWCVSTERNCSGFCTEDTSGCLSPTWMPKVQEVLSLYPFCSGLCWFRDIPDRMTLGLDRCFPKRRLLVVVKVLSDGRRTFV